MVEAAGFAASLILITLAEMGDKTQLLALSFAARYRPAKVLTGVFIATLLVHLFSVAVGRAAGGLLPTRYLEFAIGLSFIAFGAWTLKGDSLQDVGEARSKAPVATVAIAFFLAELGDKTQLATVSLSAKYGSFLGVWLGSTLGMVVADGIAIVAGAVAGKRLPQRAIRWLSAMVFILFGLATIARTSLR